MTGTAFLRWFIPSTLLILLLAACGGAGVNEPTDSSVTTTGASASAESGELVQSASGPTVAWQSSTPEEQGMDSEALADLVSYVQDQSFTAHSLLIIRNGYIVTDAYFFPYAPDEPHYLASATKSFTSTLIGIAIEQDHIESVDQDLLGFFPERTVANLNAS